MGRRLAALLVSALGLTAAAGVRADSVTGVCPDGSFFVVREPEDAPCSRSKLVDPADLPPIRPQLLPRPYTWYVDQVARDPNNPYNLLEAAEKIREARARKPRSESAISGARAPELPIATARELPRPGVALPQLSEAELRDLLRVVQMRQQVASAELRIEDLRGGERLLILLAHSEAFETIVLDWFGMSAADRRVIAFVAVAPTRPTEFHPNFFVVQGSRTFRPDPRDPQELALLAGEPGTIPEGGGALGYLVVPAEFDPARPMELWWNDRSIEALLAPDLR